MSTTRSQKRKNNQQESTESVSEGLVSPIILENVCHTIAGPSSTKSPRIENNFLDSLRASLKEGITSEIKNLLVESEKEMLRQLKPRTRENADEELENETRRLYFPTKSIRIYSTYIGYFMKFE